MSWLQVKFLLRFCAGISRGSGGDHADLPGETNRPQKASDYNYNTVKATFCRHVGRKGALKVVPISLDVGWDESRLLFSSGQAFTPAMSSPIRKIDGQPPPKSITIWSYMLIASL
jgi:hypothetical protein